MTTEYNEIQGILIGDSTNLVTPFGLMPVSQMAVVANRSKRFGLAHHRLQDAIAASSTSNASRHDDRKQRLRTRLEQTLHAGSDAGRPRG